MLNSLLNKNSNDEFTEMSIIKKLDVFDSEHKSKKCKRFLINLIKILISLTTILVIFSLIYSSYSKTPLMIFQHRFSQIKTEAIIKKNEPVLKVR